MTTIGNFLGIDPGRYGGIALLSPDGIVQAWEMPETEKDLALLFKRRIMPTGVAFCLIEKVGAWKEKGAAGSFVFGRNAGVLIGILHMAEISFDEISPQTWQKAMGIPPRIRKPRTRKPLLNYPEPETSTQWKRRLLARAEELFPGMRISLGTADALILVELARRIFSGYQGGRAI